MMLGKFDLDNKIAFVTGCKREIDKAIAITLVQAGTDIIGISSTLEDKNSEIENEVKKTGKKFKGYKTDFSNRASLYSFINKVKKTIFM